LFPKPLATLAIWGYGLLEINPEVDLYIKDYYVNIVGPYWDKERRLIDEEYKTILFPFEEIKSPAFSFSFQWTITELKGYLTTWSAVQKFMKEKNFNPVDGLVEKILEMVFGAWIGISQNEMTMANPRMTGLILMNSQLPISLPCQLLNLWVIFIFFCLDCNVYPLFSACSFYSMSWAILSAYMQQLPSLALWLPFFPWHHSLWCVLLPRSFCEPFGWVPCGPC